MELYPYIEPVPRRRELAAALGNSPDYIWQVATHRAQASPHLAIAIERETARLGPECVPRWTLRPDLWEPPAFERSCEPPAAPPSG